MKKKIVYIANAQVIGCLLVVFGHSYPFNVYIPALLESIKNFVYCFHMPLFVFVSGFLVVKADSIKKYGSLNFIKNRALKLLIPYAILSIIGIAPKVLMKNYINDKVEITANYLIRIFLVPRENIWGHFWFLPMIFVFAVLSVLIIKVLEKSYKTLYFLLVVGIILLFLPPMTSWFGINDIKNFIFYYILGMFIAKTEEFEKYIMPFKFIWICLPAALIIQIIESDNSFIHIAIGLVTALLMILLTIWISGKLHFKQIRVAETLNQNIYPIFLLSWPCQVVVEVFANRILHINVLIVMILMFFAGVLGPLLIVKMICFVETHTPIRFLSIIIGGNSNEKRTTCMEN